MDCGAFMVHLTDSLDPVGSFKQGRQRQSLGVPGLLAYQVNNFPTWAAFCQGGWKIRTGCVLYHWALERVGRPLAVRRSKDERLPLF